MDLNEREKITERQEQPKEMSSEEIAKKVAEAVEETDKKVDPTAPFVLSSGATVRARPIPEVFSQAILRKIPRPRPPKVKIEDEEDGRVRWEENPNDPNYRWELVDWESALTEALTNLALLRGVEVLKHPDGFKSMDDDEIFFEDMDALGMDLEGMSRAQRKLLWMKYRIVTQLNDLQEIQERIQELAGIDEEDIAQQMSLFRGEGGRDSGSGVVGG